MKKVYYEKVGRKYVPVAEYDSDYHDSFNKGTHIVMSYPGGQSRRYNIDPAFGPMIAAGRFAEDAMCTEMRKQSELRPQQNMITEGQRKAWKKLAKEFGSDLCPLQHSSAHDIVAAGINAMKEEAKSLMTHASVREACDHFLLVCELTKQHSKTN